MDAYVFVRDADDATLKRLKKLEAAKTSAVRFATSITGPFDALVAVRAEHLAAVERTVRREIRPAGGRGTETALVVPVIPLPMPKAKPPARCEAFVTVRVQPGKVESVVKACAKIPGVMGVACVAGRFDLLVEVGGPNFERVSTTVLARLQRVKGITSTRSYFADFPEAARTRKTARTKPAAKKKTRARR